MLNAICPSTQLTADGAPADEQCDALVNFGASLLDKATRGVEEPFEGDLDFTRAPADYSRRFGMVMLTLVDDARRSHQRPRPSPRPRASVSAVRYANPRKEAPGTLGRAGG